MLGSIEQAKQSSEDLVTMKAFRFLLVVTEELMWLL